MAVRQLLTKHVIAYPVGARVQADALVDLLSFAGSVRDVRFDYDDEGARSPMVNVRVGWRRERVSLRLPS